jgi:hypothetical protein
MSFETYHYSDVGYQPEPSDEPIAPPKGGSGVPNNDPTHQEQIIFNRVKESLMNGNFGISIDFKSIRNIIATAVAKEICNLAITAKKTDDEIIEKMNKILVAMAKINQRIYALENKQPAYVSPPVIGPTKRYCDRCGNYVDINHICFGR